MRRFLAGLAPNNLNSQFGTMLTRLNNEKAYAAESGSVKERLEAVMLLTQKDWPDDDVVRTGVLREDFYNNGDTGQKLLILRSLDQSFGYQLKPNYVQSDKSIEHIMPQSKTPEWRGDLRELGRICHCAMIDVLTLENLLVTPEI